jgi:beta-lactamase class A
MTLDIAIGLLVADFPGRVSIVISQPGTGERISINEDLPFPAASLIKLPILWEFFMQCERGQLDPDEVYRLAEADKVQGFGVLRQLEAGATLRFMDLATLMIVVSDNTATNLLIDRLGMEAIENTIQALGLQGTSLKRKMFDHSDPTLENFVTARDVERILQLLLFDNAPLGKYRDRPRTILAGQQCKNKIHVGFPKDTWIASKTGDSPGLEHDAGLVRLGTGEYILVVLTNELTCNYDGIELCRQAARLLYRHAA